MKKSYTEKPLGMEIQTVDETKSRIFLRENIMQSKSGWECDEYQITASPENLVARVEKNRVQWIEQAKESKARRGNAGDNT